MCFVSEKKKQYKKDFFLQCKKAPVNECRQPYKSYENIALNISLLVNWLKKSEKFPSFLLFSNENGPDYSFIYCFFFTPIFYTLLFTNRQYTSPLFLGKTATRLPSSIRHWILRSKPCLIKFSFDKSRQCRHILPI